MELDELRRSLREEVINKVHGLFSQINSPTSTPVYIWLIFLGARNFGVFGW